MKIGVISDTHNFLDSKVLELFQGVEHICHGGDVGNASLLLELEKIAPVTAVLGNTDSGLQLKEIELTQCAGKRILIHHIVDPFSLEENFKAALGRTSPDVVIFGHTHKPFCQQVGPILFVNPGYAGRMRFQLPRSVALLETDTLQVDFRML